MPSELFSNYAECQTIKFILSIYPFHSANIFIKRGLRNNKQTTTTTKAIKEDEEKTQQEESHFKHFFVCH